MMVRDLLDTKSNPFYRQADRMLFVARRQGKPVGRIAAIENRAHNAFHQDRVGFFGFFESVDDGGVAGSLFAAAEEWLRSRGLTSMRGPMNPSTNHDCGLLVDGFDQHPQFLTSWNPPNYEGLIRGAGFAVAKDLLGYWLPYGDPARRPLEPATPFAPSMHRRQTFLSAILAAYAAASSAAASLIGSTACRLTKSSKNLANPSSLL